MSNADDLARIYQNHESFDIASLLNLATQFNEFCRQANQMVKKHEKPGVDLNIHYYAGKNGLHLNLQTESLDGHLNVTIGDRWSPQISNYPHPTEMSLSMKEYCILTTKYLMPEVKPEDRATLTRLLKDLECSFD